MVMRVEALSRRTGISRETIRYYTRAGLLRPKRDESNGYRQFDESDIKRLSFILKAKALGLSLAQIAEIIRTAEEGRLPCDLTRAYVADRLAEVCDKIAELSKLRANMERALELWERLSHDGDAEGSICPLIESVDVGE